MEEFLYDMATAHALPMPLYYFRLGLYDLNCGVLVSAEAVVII